ncbi:MAG: hypothetical protein F2873_04830 [Actinobacteria bacterium]|nr:hypothetical protein [Actinomycetota bacterium]
MSGSARRLAPLAASVVNQALTRTATAQQRLVVATRTHVSRATARLDSAENHVRLLDPVHTLARGWSITRNGKGNVVRSVADTSPGDALVTTVADGTIRSTVQGTNP